MYTEHLNNQRIRWRSSMSDCSMTISEESKSWPDAVIGAKLTMNPYLLAMAADKALESGMKLWEFINLAVWERLGRPDHDALMGFAARMDVDEEDPKWKKRLKLTARYEVELARLEETMMTEANEMLQGQGGD
jgi:hypothetical protein